ncbi:tRNA (adenine(22)-N(1))-methyltransferase [Planococcus salinus]|uniref:tRNA (Adenine-N(1))-methyltransferase n=1 Tax=Planococcus salinus TaxID=1848460 RepID=A0A3M8PBL5_9BACL|nr:tRNA (adenine(22)-N(1))-methyltransferase TrmK [Planococcus salinus]RNF41033.1 tRNA (adenine-N(1))-methyltransferase [Planococcus salinus]
MNAQQLSNRLMRVAHHVPAGAVVADIGSDHAYLPCYLVLNGIAEKAIAGEVVQGPYDSARNQVIQEQLTGQIEVRLASGLGAVQPQDGVTVVTIAGMGGPLIRTILEQGKERLAGVERLVLQPNVHARSIREWAVENGWSIVNEEILKENEKIYEILILEQTDKTKELSPEELLMGPVLMKEFSAVFQEKWTKECAQWKKIISSMESAEETPELAEKKQELSGKVKLVEEVLKNENS